MSGRRPLRRSALGRYAGLVAAIFLAAFAVVFALVAASVSSYTERRIVETIRTDLAGLEDVWTVGGLPALTRILDARRAAAGPTPARIHLVVGADGERLAGDFAAWPNDLAPSGDTLAFRDPTGRAWSGQLRAIPGGPMLLVAHDRAEHDALMADLARELALPALLAALAALAAGVGIGRWLLGRIERVNAVARAVEAGDLAARVGAPPGDDEFADLARNFDAALDRIAVLMRSVHHLSEQIAHETRTPLAHLRARLERARREVAADPARAPAAFDDAIEESAKLIAVFAALLDIARAEAAAGDARGLAPVDLAAVVVDVVDLYEAVAEDRGIELAVATAPAPVLGERMLLTRLLANLVDNALKFSPAGSRVEIETGTNGDEVRLVVRDHGPGLPAGFEAIAFDRFTRAEGTHDVPGHGLGLGLVRAVALRHGMKLTLDDARPGLRVTLRAHRPKLAAM